VSLILNDANLFAEWKRDIKTMAERIIEMRVKLRGLLEGKGTPGTWRHITDQIGMFSYTGLGGKACDLLTSQGHIYLTGNGRISMAGLNRHNISYVAGQIDKVVARGRRR
jgi:aspartate aminotransferase